MRPRPGFGRDRGSERSQWAGRAGAAIALGACLAGTACGDARPAPAPHVVLVLADTLRADHLGAWGYSRPTSPALDAFAARSLLFEQASSQAPCTFPSANSILTGRHPASFLRQGEGRMGIPASIQALPSLFAAQGHATLAVSASPIVRRSASPHNPGAGFGEGFERFDEECLWKTGDCVNERLSRALGEGPLERPLFLYLHYMDPHDPYQLPPDRELRFAGTYRGQVEAVRDGRPGLIRKLRREGQELSLTAGDLSHLVDLYDERIRLFDEHFAALLDLLDRRGILDRAIVALVSDHGEQFMEHGQLAHCNALYEEELHVPMILSLPGAEPGRRARIVRNLDLAPTLLDYAGLGWRELQFDGVSLRPLIETRQPVATFSMGLWETTRSVRSERHKLVFDLPSRRAEFFDLRSNPRERPGGLSLPGRVRLQLASTLADSVEHREHSASGAALAGEQAVERLRALGYIQ